MHHNLVRIKNTTLAFLFVLSVMSTTFAQQLAFPGAEGFGRFTSGGRGGVLIEVTNLNDNGPGSLREAITASGPRTVVFRVSGNIILQSSLRIKNDNITIAGQTAPGDGICIRNYNLNVDADNVIIRYMRFRLGDVAGIEADALGGTSNNKTIIDHCSVSWSVDEAASFYDNSEFTMQWCLISESLKNSVHSKGPHGYGGIWGGMGASFHHNLLAHHDSRNPRFQGSRGESTPETEIVDHRNNVIYNWDGNSAYGGESGNHNMVANYYKYGPATNTKNRIVAPSDEIGKWYITDNFVYGYPTITDDNWSGGVQSVNISKVRVYEPFPSAPVVTHTAETSYELLLADAGASLKRDSIDTRIILETKDGFATYGGLTGPGTGIIDSQTDVGGWPQLNTYDTIVDNDQDGMDDEWELENGLDPTDPEDRNLDKNGDGYTNLENYLSLLCKRSDYIVAPAELKALTISDIRIDINWKENIIEGEGFYIERSLGDTNDFEVISSVGPDITHYSDESLIRKTTYFYRVRAYSGVIFSLYTNMVTSTTLDSAGLPFPVSNPSPSNESEGAKLDVPLQWDPAIGATSYDVYIGNGDSMIFKGNQVGTNYSRQTWKASTKYFWRVDAKNDFGVSQGPLWQFTTYTPPPILVAHWRMDRGYGSLAVDASGQANHAPMINMGDENWITGIMGTSGLSFNGVDEYLLVDDKEVLNFDSTGFSLSFWLRSDKKEKTRSIMAKVDIDSGGFGYKIYNDSTENIVFELNDGKHSSKVITNSRSILTSDWAYITAVRDKGADSLFLYHNGVLVGDSSDGTGDLNNNQQLYIAANKALTVFYDGHMDDVRIYQNVLSPVMIMEHFQNAITNLNEYDQLVAPVQFSLNNYPNPFNNQTKIQYTIPSGSNVQVSIYNILGEIVAKLFNDYQNAGKYELNFNAGALSSGIYICRLQSDFKSVIHKMLLVK